MYRQFLRQPALAAVDTLFQEIPQNHWGVPDDDLDVLAGLQVASKSKRILQLGTAYGLSSIILADIAAQMGDGAMLVTVDPSQPMNEAARRYVKMAGIGGIVQVVEGLSTDTALLAELRKRQWDMIFLDTTHQYEDTRTEIELITRLCSPRTLLCLHDASKHAADNLDQRKQGGVARAIREWCWLHPRWKSFTFQGPAFGLFGIAVMQKAEVE